MSSQESNENLRRMERLVRSNADSADDLYHADDPSHAAETVLPEILRTQAEVNREMVKTFTAINDQLGTVVSDLEEVKDRQDSMAQDIDAIKTHQDSMAQDMDAIKTRQDSMADDIGQVKGGYARAEVIREAGVIAFDLGLGYVRNVEKLELAALAQKHSNSGIATADLRSFRAADLVVMGINGSEIVYLAVEISFTADHRDSDRAIRNAVMLEQFTGSPARAVVASVKNDDHVSQLIDQGLIHWHPIDQRSLDPD